MWTHLIFFFQRMDRSALLTQRDVEKMIKDVQCKSKEQIDEYRGKLRELDNELLTTVRELEYAFEQVDFFRERKKSLEEQLAIARDEITRLRAVKCPCNVL